MVLKSINIYNDYGGRRVSPRFTSFSRFVSNVSISYRDQYNLALKIILTLN
jgi:hypothetical protein